tara:strand:- start:11579 stop:11806 length:228 start_codon:yes stop_codon:yes gene_type:complete
MEPIIECQTINFCELEKWFIFLLPFIVGFLSFWIGYLYRALGKDTWLLSTSFEVIAFFYRKLQKARKGEQNEKQR